jgi:hypothetical protein
MAFAPDSFVPQEPISFAASRKEQLVKIIFDSLANAKKANHDAGPGKENAAAARDRGGAARAGKASRAAAGVNGATA